MGDVGKSGLSKALLRGFIYPNLYSTDVISLFDDIIMISQLILWCHILLQ